MADKRLMARCLIVIVSVFCIPSSAICQKPDAKLEVKVDGSHVFMSQADFQELGLIFHDCTFPFIRLNKNDYWFYISEPGANDKEHSRIHRIKTDGLTIDKNTLQRVPMEGIPDANVNNLNGWKAWIFNLYEINSKEWLAITHLEDQDQVDPSINKEEFKMGLAYSNDGAKSFVHLGFITSIELPTSVIKSDECHKGMNIAGGGFRCDDEYMYVYFLDYSKPDKSKTKGAVARAKISEVVQNAREGKNTAWKKYYNGQWTEPGLGGRSANIGHAGNHNTLMYNTYLNQWICFNRRGKNLLMYRTSDPMDFNIPGEVVYEFPDDHWAYYYSILPNQEDMSTCGQEFNIYYSDVREGVDRHLARLKITLNLNP